jgi:flagellar basal body-associated protein FliL
MSSLVRVVIILAVVILLGGIVALSMWNLPNPSAKIEKVIPDERFRH